MEGSGRRTVFFIVALCSWLLSSATIAWAVNSISLASVGEIILHPGIHAILPQPGARACMAACVSAHSGENLCEGCPMGVQLAGRHLIIRSADPAGDVGQVTVDCSKARRCFKAACLGGAGNTTCVSGSSVVLEGFTMTGGNVTLGSGGAVDVDGPQLTMRHVRVTNCHAARGGGLHVKSSHAAVLLERARFDGCSAFDDPFSEVSDGRGRGGAVFAARVRNLTASGCDFRACAADEAAAMSLQSVQAYIHGCTFRDSTARWQAAGLKVDYWSQASNLTVTNSSFVNLHTGEPDGGEQAGAVAWGGVESTWVDVYAFNCSDKGAYGGGFFHSFPPNIGDTRSTFTRVHVKGCRAGFGGAFVFGAGSAVFRNSLVEACRSEFHAGGVFIAPLASRMLFVDTNITGCSSHTEGGAVSSYGLDVEFRG
eukprot:jgi/Mesen1/10303/ME000079S09727